ncbi:MAG: hypothetical protein NC318_12195 [Blautia sp.]|nr:hypothetical protein [Lachnoclostridium sp.]MCM1212353.1 hypothetical protein [Blautia sp.]
MADKKQIPAYVLRGFEGNYGYATLKKIRIVSHYTAFAPIAPNEEVEQHITI